MDNQNHCMSIKQARLIVNAHKHNLLFVPSSQVCPKNLWRFKVNSSRMSAQSSDKPIKNFSINCAIPKKAWLTSKASALSSGSAVRGPVVEDDCVLKTL